MIVCLVMFGRTHKQMVMTDATLASAWIDWAWNGPAPETAEKPALKQLLLRHRARKNCRRLPSPSRHRSSS